MTTDYCIIADFEWAVTPHAAGRGDRFFYLNEILSAGAVKFDKSGCVVGRFYALVRPDEPEYLYPIILSSLRLDRAELAAADDFPTVYEEFLAFADGLPIYTWGGADRSALTQNLAAKGKGAADAASVPAMHDIQPFIARSLELRMPYPSLASTLSMLSLNEEGKRHNALSDAEDTALILSCLEAAHPGHCASLFAENSVIDGSAFHLSEETSADPSTQMTDAFRQAKKRKLSCPECGACLGTGVWYPLGENEQITVCSCEHDGKFLCILQCMKENGSFAVHEKMFPFTDDAQRRRYETARRAARRRFQAEKLN